MTMVTQHSGCKVGWETYDSEAEAAAASSRAVRPNVAMDVLTELVLSLIRAVGFPSDYPPYYVTATLRDRNFVREKEFARRNDLIMSPV